jgi:hypothetical protein
MVRTANVFFCSEGEGERERERERVMEREGEIHKETKEVRLT